MRRRKSGVPTTHEYDEVGRSTSGLLAQVLVAKYLDHLPLYKQEAIPET
ncbi:transposase [Variovorax paradoxus]|nr:MULTISPECIES: hypothetical protein [Variovorax]MDR6522103.1 transposase [Variovorax paradoxus]